MVSGETRLMVHWAPLATSHFGNVLEMFHKPSSAQACGELFGISASGKRSSSKAKAAGRKALIDFFFFFLEEFMV